MARKTFVVAMKEFFGLLPGQGNMQFFGELKKLTEADKAEFYAGLTAAGVDCDPPGVKVTVAAA